MVGVDLDRADSLLEVVPLLAIQQYFVEDEVLPVLEFVLLDVVLDLGLNAFLALHPSQGRPPDLVSLLPLIAAEDELGDCTELLLLLAPFDLVTNQAYLALEIFHQQAQLECLLLDPLFQQGLLLAIPHVPLHVLDFDLVRADSAYFHGLVYLFFLLAA